MSAQEPKGDRVRPGGVRRYQGQLTAEADRGMRKSKPARERLAA
jgi:hypothetical protein